jgi:hypothetical protein
LSHPIDDHIRIIRGHKVMLDRDLAVLYGVATGALNQAVRRHLSRFPEDFMFTLTEGEVRDLKSQTVPSNWGGRRKLPSTFTEHGVAMLSALAEPSVRISLLSLLFLRLSQRNNPMTLVFIDNFLARLHQSPKTGLIPSERGTDEGKTHSRHRIGRVRLLLESMASEVPRRC